MVGGNEPSHAKLAVLLKYQFVFEPVSKNILLRT